VSVIVGQAGEHLVAAVLFEMGVQCAVCPTPGMDLVAFDHKRVWRIEVKTTTKIYPSDKVCYAFNTSRGNSKKRRLNNKTCDLLALCALPVRRVIFRNIETITGKVTRLSSKKFIEGCELQSWKAATTWTSSKTIGNKSFFSGC
jgi:Holliday junction resolvase-like predicted endonuclease